MGNGGEGDMRQDSRLRSIRRLALASLASVCASGAGLAGTTEATPSVTAPFASASRTISLVESARLRAAPQPGNTIHEQGEATGTFRCRITVELRIVSTNRITATFTVTPAGGTVTGTGSARFVAQGAYGYIGGALSISGGTGRFSHASGENIGLSGKFNRETFSANIQVHGTVHL
jgi:hypothetical protein